jgi:putative ABC transport system permease protein
LESGLNIGDTITLTSALRETNPDPDIPREEQPVHEISYTLTIVGYFDDITPEYSNNFMQNAFFNRRNEIITTADTVIAGMREGFSGIRVSATYYLRSPDMLAAFEAEVRAHGIDDMFLISTDEESYNTIVQPVLGLKDVTFAFVIAVLSLGAVILMLVSTIAVRERKYEIGVLRAMGMKKSKVALGLLSEMVIITLVCLVAGLGAGVAAAQPISDMLLENQLQQIQNEPAQDSNQTVQFGNFGGMAVGRGAGIGGMGGMGGIFGGGNTPAEALRSMDVSMSAAAVGQIILVSLILAVVSSIAGIAHVTKYEPIKILSDRT